MIAELPANKDRAGAWLKAIYGDIAFNDGRRLQEPAVLTLALSWRGLTKLGLPEYAGPTFPFAFVQGMTTPNRRRDSRRFGRQQPGALALGRNTAGCGDPDLRPHAGIDR